MFKLASAVVLLSFLTAFGCSNSTSTNPPTNSGGGSSKQPAMGSTYTKVYWSGPDDSSYSTYAEVESNANIISFRNTLTGFESDSIEYRYESNGDVSMNPIPVAGGASWFTMPFVSQAHTTMTTQPVLGETIYLDATGEGTEMMSVAGASLSVSKVRLQVVTNSPIGIDTAVSHWAFAPSIGLIVSYDEDPKIFDGTPQPAYHWLVTEYNVK